VSCLVAILGPTASGKSELALAVAERFGGEIVNYDSIQVYRHFEIGAAKLRVEDRRGIPHHLIDLLEPHEVFTAGEFARRATAVLSDIRDRGRLPVLAGGTGFYLRALLDGLFPGPTRDEALRARLTRRDGPRLHKLLARFDPTAARRIHANDARKLVRALEVTLLARRPITELFAEGRQGLAGFEVLKVGLQPDRDALYARINRRTEAMFAAGLVEETRRILALGYPETSKPFESHGYHQAVQVLRGELSLPEAIFDAQRFTRHYAKRQLTWFRREKYVTWFHGFGESPEVQEAVSKLLLSLNCTEPRP
jgi:tRNA dimethylallyltransferase